MKVILVSEDTHGLIGVTETMQDAFSLLVEKNWIYEEYVYFSSDKVEYCVKDIMDKFDLDIVSALLYLYEESEDYFDCAFYFEETEIYKKT